MKQREKLWTQGEYLMDGSTVYVLHDTTFMGKPAKENRIYAGLQGPKCPESEKLATARLFRAAPDLVEALEKCMTALERMDSDHPYLADAYAAIYKAYGDSQ